MPLAAAAAVTVTVVGALVIISSLRSGLEPAKRTAAEACEAAYAEQVPDGPAIVAGEIYAADEWREVDQKMVELGYAEEGNVSDEVAEARDSEAAMLAAAGQDVMTIVWQLDDQTHGLCVANVKDAVVLPPVTITPNLAAQPAVEAE